MRFGATSASFPNGESNRRRLLFFVAAGFILGAALPLLASSPREAPPGPPPPPRPSPTASPEEPTYRNPILFADWSDPDVIRVADDYWLVASSFQEVPGLPVLHSKDLVHWTLAGQAAPRLPSPHYDVPRHGGGVWAPSIRYDCGFFHVWYGDPDLGIFTTKARDPRGPWEPLRLVREARGWIDPCPFRDTGGSLWLVHAWARSRAGINEILTVHRLSPDNLSVLDEGVKVFDGGTRHPTIGGPKVYRRDEWVYISAPDGDEKGQIVLVHARPDAGRGAPPPAPATPQVSDEFDGPALSIAYQPNVLRTRLSAERLVATALVELHGESNGAGCGLTVLGRDAAFVAIARTVDGWEAFSPSGSDVLGGGVAREGAWVGSRLGLFTAPAERPTPADSNDVDWFRVE